MRSSNPVLKDSALNVGSGAVADGRYQTMTRNGTVNKTGLLLFLVTLTATFTWSQVIGPDGSVQQSVAGYLVGGAVGAFILSLVTTFKMEWSPFTAPLFALMEGFSLGAISAVYETRFHGIIFQAVLLTFATLFALLLAYRTGWIRATEKFKLGVFGATAALALFYLVAMILGLFHVPIPLVHSNGPMGIIFSLVVVAIAALNLVLDFDFIDRGVSCQAPKYMEWYGAFGLLVTLVWLYVEFIRLLSKFNSRD